MFRAALPALLLCACLEEDDAPASAEGVESDAGLYRLDLVMTPDPPTAGPALLEVGLAATDGQPVTGASIGLVPWMPAHDHGVMGDVVVEESGQGDYTASWDYPMSGAWELRFTLDGTEGVDTLTLEVDVE